MELFMPSGQKTDYHCTTVYLDMYRGVNVIFSLTLLMIARAASARTTLRQARITRAPLRAKSIAVSLPIPVLLPAEPTIQVMMV